jgi:phosphoglycolate phosphatase
MTNRTQIRLLITDVDNTLYDWVSIWYASFSALLDSVIEISGLPREVVESEVRAVHQRVGTSEYSFLLQELSILADVHGTDDYLPLYEPAIAAFRRARSDATTLYPGVQETLKIIKASGVTIVAYTESLSFHTALRFRWLDLDGLIDVLYSPTDHDISPTTELADVRQHPDEYYRLKVTSHRHTPSGHFKPDTDVLASIVNDFGIDFSSTLYVGDSLTKDIAMAQKLSVRDAFASYGVAQFRDSYDLLRRVSHWSDEDVERERRLLEMPTVSPTVVLTEFSELLTYFEFQPVVRE